MSGRSIAMLAALATPACVAEHDVGVYVVLPARCAELGAVRAVIGVATLDGEAFAVEADPCTDSLAGEELSGFSATIERVGADYHRADVTVEDAAGVVLGGRSLPFPGDEVLVVPLSRADLPAWPTAELAVTIPACVAGGGVTELRLTATIATSASPEADLTITCDTGAPAAPVLVLPRGPATIAAEATCWRGEVDAVVGGGGGIELALARSCP